MKLTPIALAATLTASSAQAQFFTETYDGGSNEGDYEIWFSVYNTIETSGGNPGAYLRLDNFNQGPGTCQYIDIFPNQWPNAYSGDYRALGVDRITIDVNMVEGPIMVPGTSAWRLRLVDDNGTNSTADDCALFLTDLSILPPTGPGWMTVEFPIPSASPTLPMLWGVEGTSCSGNNDATWNAIIQSVDYVEFRLHQDPSMPCAFNNRWDFGVDNFSIYGGGPIGTPYCATLPNSSGFEALLSGFGSAVASGNNVNFDVVQLPLNKFGYFLMGENQAQIPVAQGFLCIGNPQIRFDGSILNSGASGTASFSPDLDNLPQNTQIMAGDTWNFQMWYRDNNPGVTSNFSTPLEIPFL